MTRVKQVKQNDLSKVDAYHLSYFRQAVSTLIGPLCKLISFTKRRVKMPFFKLARRQALEQVPVG